MDDVIGKKFPFFTSLVLLPVMICVSLLLLIGLPAGAEDSSLGDLVTDPLGAASFMPPKDWVRWDFWGAMAFSPAPEHNPRITFIVTSYDDADGDRADNAMRDYESTFSTRNYTLIQKENLYLNGWSGIRILAGGTEENSLFGRDYIWIQEYFTNRDRISLVFHGDPASFETYRDTVLRSFRSLIIIERGQDGS
jgi:hypothetical protein